MKSTLRMSMLMDMAASHPETAAEHLASVYQWKHEHSATTGKALAGAGLALLIAPIVPVVAPNAEVPLSWLAVIVTWAGAAVLLGAGVVVFTVTRRLEAEYLAAQNILAELVDIHPFLKLYKGRSV